MNVLKNYKILKETYKDFRKVEIRYNDSEVFAELPVGIIPYGHEYNEPYLVQISMGLGVFLEKDKLDEYIEQLEKAKVTPKEHEKLYHLKEVDGELKEVSEEEATHSVILPKDVDVKSLALLNNEVVLRELVKVKEKE